MMMSRAMKARMEAVGDEMSTCVLLYRIMGYIYTSYAFYRLALRFHQLIMGGALFHVLNRYMRSRRRDWRFSLKTL